MNEHLDEFKRRKEEGKLSHSAYNNLIYNNLNMSQHNVGEKRLVS